MNKNSKKSKSQGSRNGPPSASVGGVQSKRSRNGSNKATRARSIDQISSIPAASGIVRRAQRPTIQGQGRGGDCRITVRHRELLRDINGSVAFASTREAINPGLIASFPWLSNIAQSYESYHFKQLRYDFCTTTGSTTAGTVLMYIDFDASDLAPSNKAEASAHQGSVRCSAWDPCCSLIATRANLDKFTREHFVRHGAVASTDIKNYDIGNLYVCTSGMTGASMVGELFVSYEVELMTPQVHTFSPWDSSAKITEGPVPTPAIPWGSAPSTVCTDENIVAATNGTNSILNIANRGEYLVEHILAGTGLLNGAMTHTVVQGAANIATIVTQLAPAAGTSSVGSYRIEALTVPLQLAISAVGIATTITAAVSRLVPYKYSSA